MTDQRPDSADAAAPVVFAHRIPLLSHQLVRFVLASGVAAAANFFSRILFNVWTSYVTAVVLAFLVGLTSAFLLNRYLVFRDATNRLHEQIFWFVLVNLFALVQTLLVTLLFADFILPRLGIAQFRESLAHGLGILAPIVTSYLAHQRLSFKASA